MDCPHCGLINPDSAGRCDCGYDFPSRTMQKPYTAMETCVKRPTVEPPRLHWGWVLALRPLTGGLSDYVLLIVESNWSRKMRGKSAALPMSIILFPAQVVLTVLLRLGTGSPSESAVLWWPIAGALLWIPNLLTLRGELNELLSADVPGFSLSGPMSVLLGPVYFQYHLRDYQGTT